MRIRHWLALLASSIRTRNSARPLRHQSQQEQRVESLEVRSLLAATLSATLDGSNNLVITDISGSATNDTLTLKSDTTSSAFIISDSLNEITTVIAGATGSGTNNITIPFASVTGLQIIVNTLGGDDALTIDLSLGDLSTSVVYDGGTQTTSDSLTITGGLRTFTAVTHTTTSASAGTIAVTGNSTIGYTGLEPVTDNLSATDRVFTFEGGAETITLTDATGANMTIDSTFSESITFANPSGSLTINAGTGDDMVTVNSVDIDGPFDTALAINGDDGSDIVNQNATLSLGTVIVTSNVALTAEVINVNGSIDTTLGATDGMVTLVGDQQTLAASINAGAAIVSISPQTSGASINLGGTSQAVVTYTMSGYIEPENLAVNPWALSGDGLAATSTDGAAYSLTVVVATNAVDRDSINPGVASFMPVSASLTIDGQPVSMVALENGNLGGLEFYDNQVSGLFDVLQFRGEATLNGSTQQLLLSQRISASSFSLLASPGTDSPQVFAPTSAIQTGAAGGFSDYRTFMVTGSPVAATAGTQFVESGFTLTDAELDLITAGTIRIGDMNSGAIAFTATIDRAVSTHMVLTTAANNNIALGTFSLDAGAVGDISMTTSGTGAITTGDNSGNDLIGDDVVLSAGSGGIGDGINFIRLSANTISAVSTGGIDGYCLSAAGSIIIAPGGFDGGTINRLGGGTFVLGGADRIANDDIILISSTTKLMLNGFNETVRAIAGDATSSIVNGSATPVTLTFEDSLSGYNLDSTLGGLSAADNNFSINKPGSGSANIGGANTYTGTTTIGGGRMNLTGSLADGSAVTVQSTATLAGTGTAAGTVIVQSGGHVSPAASPGTFPGVLNSGSVSLTTGSFYDVEIGGTVPGNAATNHDQLIVTGSVSLGGATLTMAAFNGFVPIVGNTFAILLNDGSDAISGTFAGLTEGTLISNFFSSGLDATISYVANADGGLVGNDVVLTAVSAAVTETNATLDGSGNLVISDSNGSSNDGLTIQSDTANSRFVITDPSNSLGTSIAGATGNGTNTLTIPFASVTGSQIIVNTLGGDDSLTIDLSLGDLSKSVTYDGGTQITSDSLTVTGGARTFSTVTHTTTSASSGSIAVMGNSTISYTGLEPVTDNLSASDRVFDFTGGAETITLTDATGVNMTIDSTLSESITFANPTNSLTINAGTGDDTVTVTSVDAAYGVDFTINGDAGVDTINLNADITFVLDRRLSVNADSVATGAGTDLATSGVGTMAITADDIAINATSTLDSASALLLRPETAGRAIDLGTETAGQLSLTDAELDRITTTSRIIVGSSTAGAVTFSAAIAMTNSNVLEVITGSTINDTGTSTVFTDTSLALNAATGIGTSSPLNVAVSNLAATAVSGGVSVLNLGDVNLTTVGGVSGASASAGSVTVIGTGGITVSQPLSAAGSGLIQLLASSNIVVNNSITTANGTMSLQASGNITSNSNGTLTSTQGLIHVTADSDNNGSGTINYTAAVNHGLAGSRWSLADADGSMSGVISGVGFLTKLGNGTLSLNGTSANTFTGTTVVNAGTLLLGKTSGLNAIGGSLTIGDFSGTDTVKLLNANQIPDTTDVSINSGGVLDLNSQPETIDALTGSGSVTSSVAGVVTLTVGATGDFSAAFLGVISDGTGTVALTKTGPEVQTLAGTNTYTGSTTISSGTLRIVGSTASGSAVTVQSGARLDGTGTVGGTVNVQSGGTVAPGNSPGILNTGSVTMTSGSIFSVEIGGTAPGNGVSNHDQLVVTGSVTLGSATLTTSAFNGFVPANGNTFAILLNDSSDSISGTFSGLPEGGTISNFLGSGLNATISYVANADGGTVGNDVVLTVSAAGETTAALDGSNNLVITDDAGGTSNDSLTIQSDSANSRFILNDPNNTIGTVIAGATGSGTNTVFIPFASVTGSQIFVNTLAGDDSLTVDLSLGDFAKSISYDGGAQTASDSLTITGGARSFTTVTHSIVNASSGSITVNGNSIFSYSGLEPVADNLSATDRIFTFTGGAETITVTDTGGADGKMTIDSTLGESIAFANPTNSLTINAGTGDDIVNLNSFDAAFNASLSVNGDGATDTVNVNAGLALTSTNGITLDAETFNVGAFTLSTVNGHQIYNGELTVSGSMLSTSGTGVITLGGNVTVSGGVASTFAGKLDLNSGTRTFTVSDVAVGNDLLISAAVAGVGDGLVKAGSGEMLLSGSNTYSGVTQINTGTLVTSSNSANIGDGSATNSLIFNGGTLAMGGFTSPATRPVQFLSDAVIRDSGFNNAILGQITGSGGLIKQQAGVLTIGNTTNTFGGVGKSVTVEGGTLSVPSDSALGDVNNSITYNGSGTPALRFTGTTTSNRSVALTQAGRIEPITGTSLTMNGLITGAGNLHLGQFGGGMTVTLTNGSNNYTGVTNLEFGTLVITADHALGSAVGRTTATTGTVIDFQNVSYATAEEVELNNATLRVSTGTSTLAGDVRLNLGTPIIDVAGTHLTISGVVNGIRNVQKTGSGILVLAGANTFTSQMTVSGGTLLVHGSIIDGTNATDVVMQTGTTLGGTGTVGGAVSAQAGSTVNPGPATGSLGVGGIAFATGSTLVTDLSGTTPGTNYDQLNVVGTVTLNNATFSPTLSFAPADNDAFTVINNDGADAISGTFLGYSEGAVVNIGGTSFVISYVGGTGNDVVLTADTATLVVTSFTRFTPATSPTTSDTLVFRATFTEDAFNVDATDFTVNSATTATITSVTPISGSLYDITVSGGDLASFNGTVGLDVAVGQNITDIAGNALPTAEPTTDETYVVDNLPPTADIIDVTPDPRFNAVATISIVFNQAVTGFDLNDLSLTLNAGPNLLTGAQTLTTGDNITFTLGNLAGLTGTDGIYVLTLTAAGSGIADLATNAFVTDASDDWEKLPAIFDFGDAPDSYGTLDASSGPFHLATGLRLGATRDNENDANAPLDGTGDDITNSGSADDEDGSLVLAPIVRYGTSGVRVTASAPGFLDAWLDLDANGVFSDPAERFGAGGFGTAGSLAVPAGITTIVLDIPAAVTVVPTTTYARFRLSTAGGLAANTGFALDGEIEDQVALIAAPPAFVRVDDSYAGATPGDVLDGGIFGYDRFDTLAQAILVVADGGTVGVNAGTYPENVVIDKNVTLDGMSGIASDVIINPPGAATPGIAIGNGAYTVTISDLSVTDAFNGIESQTTATLSVSNVDASNNAGDGLNVSGAASVSITNSTLNSNGDDGIDFNSASGDLTVNGSDAISNAALGLNVSAADSVTVGDGSFSGLLVRNTNDFTTQTALVTSTKAIDVETQNAITLNASVNAGANTIRFAANLDGLGSDAFTMASGTSLSTTNDTPTAIDISVNTLLGGTGNAVLGAISAGTTGGATGGRITINTLAGAILDGNGAALNATAGNAILRANAGVGTALDAIESSLSNLEGSGGSGGFYVTNSGALTIGLISGIVGVSTTTGAIEVASTGALTVAENVSGGGFVSLLAGETAGSGDDLTVNGGVIVRSTANNVELAAGDDIDLQAGALIESLTGTVFIKGDSGNADVLGSNIVIDALINSALGTTVNGDSDDDAIFVTAMGTGGLLLDGLGGNDDYTLTYPDLPTTFGSTITINDSVSGNDEVTVYGTNAPDNLFLTTQDPPTTATTEEVSRGAVGTERIVLHDNVDFLAIYLLDEIDVMNTQPSTLFPVFLHGGEPCFGDPGVPPGDQLVLDPFGNTFSILGNVITTDGGYEPISFTDFESLPLVPLGTPPGGALLLDFNHTNTASSFSTSPTQTGYIGVPQTTLYSDGLGYGWQFPVKSYERDDGFYDNTYSDLTRDGHWFDAAATFTVDLPNGWYLASAMVGSPYTALSGAAIRNADTGGTLVSNITTDPGESKHYSFPVFVSDGTLDLEFVHGVAYPQIFAVNGLALRPGVLLSMGLDCPPGGNGADGVTIDSFTLFEAPPNSLITITTSNGTIMNVDEDDEIDGIQIRANALGQATVELRRPTGAGTVVLTFEEVTGAKTGVSSVEYVSPSTRLIDFNHVNLTSSTGQSPTQAPVAAISFPDGFNGVPESQIYSALNGFGWIQSPRGFDLGGLTNSQGEAVSDPNPLADLRRDGAYDTAPRTFRIDLPNGSYSYTATIGYDRDLDGMQINANGSLVSDIAVGAGQRRQINGTFTVTNGFATFTFSDQYGDAPNWVINGFEIRPVITVAPIIFTPNIGATPSDGITVTPVRAITGLADGEQVTVTASLGTIITPDVNQLIDGIQVYVTGGQVLFDVLAPTIPGTPTFTATSLDGSHAGTMTSAAFMSFVFPTGRRFDFNHLRSSSSTGPSKTAVGFVGVLRTDLDRVGDGFGWDQAPNSYDNAVFNEYDNSKFPQLTTDLYSDVASGHTSLGSRTFSVLARPGATYDLTVYLGGVCFGMSTQVAVEGIALPQSINLEANHFDFLQFFGAFDADADGYVEISFSSTGATTNFWSANGLDIVESGSGLPLPAPISAKDVGTGYGVDALTQADLAPLVTLAINAWAAQGISAHELALLQATRFMIRDLGNGGLALVDGNRGINLDDNAAGHGWSLQADKPAGDRYDLLTVLAHEMGHLLGQADLNPETAGDELMNAFLGLGERHDVLSGIDGFFSM